MSECRICHRPLRSLKSIQLGMGKKCAEKAFQPFSSNQSPKTNTQIIKAYLRATEEEKAITPAMENIAKAVGAKLVGLEFRIKTLESFARKIFTDISQGKKNEQAINEVFDAVRYTMTKDGNELVTCYKEAVTDLENQGFKLIRVKNTWLNPANPYKGVNVVLATRSGYRFEIQFHTPESLETKEKIHALYEMARLTDTPEERVKELKSEMKRISEGLNPPDNILQIEERGMTK